MRLRMSSSWLPLRINKLTEVNTGLVLSIRQYKPTPERPRRWKAGEERQVLAGLASPAKLRRRLSFWRAQRQHCIVSARFRDEVFTGFRQCSEG